MKHVSSWQIFSFSKDKWPKPPERYKTSACQSVLRVYYDRDELWSWLLITRFLSRTSSSLTLHELQFLFNFTGPEVGTSFSQISSVCLWRKTLSVQWTLVSCCSLYFFFSHYRHFPLYHAYPVRKTSPPSAAESLAVSSFLAPNFHPYRAHTWPQPS